MHLSAPSKAIKFLYVYATAPPHPQVWALKPPSWALVHKPTYAPMIYTALCIVFWMRLDLKFLGPKWHSPIRLMPFHRAQPSPTCPHNGYARIQNIMHGAV
jgi:hypothetical protein